MLARGRHERICRFAARVLRLVCGLVRVRAVK